MAVVVVALLSAGAGCHSPEPGLRTLADLSVHSHPLPPPARTDEGRPVVRATAGPGSPPRAVEQASFTEQAQPVDKPAAPSPDPKPKLGDVPPPPSKEPPPVAGSPPSVGGPLSLDEVLVAVEQHHPLLRAIEQERNIAGGRLVSSMGAFDLNLTGSADGQGTTYDSFRSGVGVSQALMTGGVGLFAGYRNGYGEYPTYSLGQKTADGGEFRVGASIPLLRDRDIDRPRAAVQQARLDVALAEPAIDRLRLDFQRAAARTYWNWVASGQRLKIVESLVKLAEERDDQLKGRVAAGPTANIDRIDNQQNIAQRNAFLVQAQRGFQQAAIDLSLFLRDLSGSPTLAGLDRLPTFPDIQPVDPKVFEAGLRTAFESRPEFSRLRFLREKADVELRLATNQTLPGLNAIVATSQDVGRGKSTLSGSNGLERTTLSAGVMFQLPVQRRDARGRMLTAQAQLAQIEQQLRQAEDVVRADVQDTFSALERAYEFYQQAKKRVELARLVARAERQLFQGGRSEVLRVTLREQAAFDADVVEIAAQQDYFRALADFRAAVGMVAVPEKR